MSDVLIPSYPKVYAIGHPALEGLLDGDIVVQEKVDGSQFSFMVIDGQLYMRSKGAVIFPGNVQGLFAPTANNVIALFEAGIIPEGLIFRGEALCKPKHNALAYDKVPMSHLALFDIEVAKVGYLNRIETGGFLKPNEVAQYGARLGFSVVPFFQGGTLDSAESVLRFMERDSFLGGQKVEGIVIKNHARFGRDGKFLAGKYVSEDFKEVHKKSWGESNPNGSDIIERIAESLRTDARWLKAVQHRRESGELQSAPQDIGPLLASIKKDVTDEEREDIQRQVLDWALPKILRAATAGFPEWYKRQLLEQGFKGLVPDEPALPTTDDEFVKETA